MGKWVMVVFLAAATAAQAGFILVEENDVVAGSDRHYTQGLEAKVTMKPEGGRRDAWGLRNLMYTPEDISVSEPQPDDRPWAGLSGVFFERWQRKKSRLYVWEVSAGVVGEESLSGPIQEWFHDMIGSGEPQGWHHQVPTELFVQAVFDVYSPAFRAESGWWAADLTMVGGAQLGTAFMNMEAGGLFRAGYNVPEDYKTGLVKPTKVEPGFSCYGFVELTGRLVVHNVTLGGSLFQDGPSQDMIPMVAERRVGLAVGLLKARGMDMSLSYSYVTRSPEFEGQEEEVNFGSVRLAFERSL